MIEPIEDRWDDARAASLDAAGLLLYRSNLLGSDLRITNYGGGNTSAKITETDPLTGEQARTLWVKGSGGDLGSMTRAGFAVLYLARLLGLERQYRGLAQEDDMVDLLPLCAFGKSSVAPSIDTPLHAYLPFEHVDHVHPDSVIAIAAAKDSERLTEEVFEGRLAWLPWQRPGFDLALKLRDAAQRRPDIDGIVLAGHGLFTWGKTSKECYRNTLAVIRRANEWLAAKSTAPAFGGPRVAALPKSRARRGHRSSGHRDPRRDRQGRAEDRAFRRLSRRARAGVLETPRRARARRHLLPRPFPAHQDSPAGGPFRRSIGQCRIGDRRSRRGHRRLPRRLRRVLRAVQAAR